MNTKSKHRNVYKQKNFKRLKKLQKLNKNKQKKSSN